MNQTKTVSTQPQANLRSCSIRFFVVCLMWLLCFCAPVYAQSNGGFLPPEQAFAFKSTLQNANTVRVQFTIAPNYYMYRDEFAFKIVSPDGVVKQVGQVKLPKARFEFDENFNKNMAIYENSVAIDIPIQSSASQTELFKIVVTSRGCARGGLCYPPRQTQAVLSAAAAPVGNTVVATDNPNKTTPTKPATAPLTSKSSEVETATVDANAPLSPTEQQTKTVNTINNTTRIDNSADSQNILQSEHIGWALLLIFGLGLLLAFTPCMLPMYPILMVVLAGQTDMRRARGAALALTYVMGMALVYAGVGILAAQTGAGLYRYMQSPWVLAVFAALLVFLALSMLGKFNIQLPSSWQTWLQHKTQGKSGFIGALLLGAASALIASPCVTAPLIGLVGYVAQTGDVFKGGLALFVLAYGMGLPLILMGAGLGRWLPKSGAWMVRIKQLFGVLMLLAALWVAQPLWHKTWLAVSGQSPNATFAPIKTLAELNAQISMSDKPVLVDIYADWCRSCIEMESKVFPDSRVKKAMSQMTLLRVDMTQYSDDDAVILNTFKLYGPPAMLVIQPKNKIEVMRVVGYQNADVFSDSLNQALQNQP